eukprot:403340488
MFDVERGGTDVAQNFNDINQLERGKSFMDIQQLKFLLEENQIKVTQDDIKQMRDKLLINKGDFVIFEVFVKKQRGKIGNIHKATLFGEEVLQFDNKFGIQVILADLEINPFQKYANLMKDYNPASVWSAPEVLKENRIQDPTKQMDVYSFGIILWELLHDQIPFNDDLKMARDYVINHDARPEIQSTLEIDIAKLIRLCWQNNPDQRPHFSVIYAKVKEC